MSVADLIDWEAWPLVPAVVQDPDSLQVLMVGFMTREALQKSADTGLVTFYSRSRETLWTKGEKSGNFLSIVELRINCELNSLLVLATPDGATCHEGYQSCYFRRVEPDGSLTLVLDRLEDPDTIYDRPNSFDDRTRSWYGAYEYLRNHELSDVSGTSKRLRDPSYPFPLRVSDELAELAGVLDGTHSHHGLIADVLLEGSQVAYWIACVAVHTRLDWIEFRPHLALSSGGSTLPRPDVAARLRSASGDWSAKRAITAVALQDVLSLVATACLSAGVDPMLLIDRDLADLRERDYLAEYFSPPE